MNTSCNGVYDGLEAGDYGQTGAIVGDASTAVRFGEDTSAFSLDQAKDERNVAVITTADSVSQMSWCLWLKTLNDMGALPANKGRDLMAARLDNASPPATPQFNMQWYNAAGTLLFAINVNGVGADCHSNYAGWAGAFITSSLPNDEQWHFVCGVWDGSVPNVKLYLDGANVATNSAPSALCAMPLHSGDVRIGCQKLFGGGNDCSSTGGDGGAPLGSVLDEWMIFKGKALTGTQVADLYEGDLSSCQ